MRRSVAVSLDTQLLPGTRVCWKRPFGDGELGTVRDVSLSFDGKGLELAGVFVAWDDPELPADSFCVDELHMLEILP
jgi:hypothetical protein